MGALRRFLRGVGHGADTRGIGASVVDYPIAQTQKIASRFRRRSNGATSQRRALRFTA